VFKKGKSDNRRTFKVEACCWQKDRSEEHKQISVHSVATLAGKEKEENCLEVKKQRS
jgi:hypothetical protein